MTSPAGENPRPGYYADPSIPGYVRYWNGSAWVPGTSRPQPKPGEVLSPPAGAAAAPATPQVAARTPAVEESGPMFLDEDPKAPVAEVPDPDGAAAPAAPAAPAAWSADPARQSGVGEDARRVSWGTAEPQQPPAGQTASGQGASGPAYGYPQAPPGGYGYPQHAPDPGTPAAASSDHGRPQQAAPPANPAPGNPAAPGSGGTGSGDQPSWQRQVQQLARKDGVPEAGAALPGAPPGAGADPGPALPWRPPVSNPFLSAQEPARPAGTVRRLVARIIDTLVVGAAVGAVAFPLAMASVRHIQDKIDAARQSGETVQVWLIDGTTGVYLAAVLGALLLAGVLYEVLPTVKWGRTLGKKLLGVRVLDIESQLTPGFGQALRRMLVRQLLDVVVVGVVNALWCLVDRPWRQCWHDKAARTFVAGGQD